MTIAGEALGKRVVRGAAVTATGQFATQLTTFAAYIVLARLASPATFGTFAAAAILVNASSLFVESGLSSALVQRREQIAEAASTAFVATLLAGVALTLVGLAAAPLIGLYFHSGLITHLALAIAPTHVVTALGVVPSALLQRRLAFARRALVDPLSLVAFGATGIVLLELGFGAWALLAASYASVTARVVVLWALAGWRPVLRDASLGMWRELVRFGRSILASEIFREGGRITVVAVVGRTLSPAGLGQFNFGARFANQLNGLIVSSSAFALFPVLSRIAGDEARLRTAFLRALRILVLVAAPASFFFLALGRPLVTLLLGARWSGAGAVLTGMCAIVLAGALISVCGETFKARGTPGLSLRAQIVLSTLTVLGVLVTYPHGLLAVGIGISFAWTVTGLYSLWLVRNGLEIPLGLIARQIALPLGAALTIALAVLLLDRHVVDAGARGAALGLPILVAETVLAGALYVWVIFMASRPQFDDLVDAIRLARRGSGLAPR